MSDRGYNVKTFVKSAEIIPFQKLQKALVYAALDLLKKL